MESAKTLQQNLDDFLKIWLHLTIIGEQLDGEHLIVILLNSQPESNEEIKTN